MPTDELSPRCREGHHNFGTEGSCIRPGCNKRDRSSKAQKKLDAEPLKTEQSTTVKLAAIAKLKALPSTDTPSTDTPSTDGIHIADIASPLVIEAEVIVGKYLSKRVFNRQIGELTFDDKKGPTESLTKWMKHRWPKVTTTPFGEMVMAQLLFLATMQLKSKPLPPKQLNPAPVSTALPDTKRDRDIAIHADSLSAKSQPDKTPKPTPKEL